MTMTSQPGASPLEAIARPIPGTSQVTSKRATMTNLLPRHELASRVVEVEKILCALPEDHARADQPAFHWLTFLTRTRQPALRYRLDSSGHHVRTLHHC